MNDFFKLIGDAAKSVTYLDVMCRCAELCRGVEIGEAVKLVSESELMCRFDGDLLLGKTFSNPIVELNNR